MFMKLVYITSNFTLKNFLADILERANFQVLNDCRTERYQDWNRYHYDWVSTETGIFMTECNIS